LNKERCTYLLADGQGIHPILGQRRDLGVDMRKYLPLQACRQLIIRMVDASLAIALFEAGALWRGLRRGIGASR
jgi:hypothetical protein